MPLETLRRARPAAERPPKREPPPKPDKTPDDFIWVWAGT